MNLLRYFPGQARVDNKRGQPPVRELQGNSHPALSCRVAAELERLSSLRASPLGFSLDHKQ